jgi:hypothetical protein
MVGFLNAMLAFYLLETVLAHYTVSELHAIRSTSQTFKEAAERVLQARFPRLTLAFILTYTVPQLPLPSSSRADVVKYIGTPAYTIRIDLTTSALTQIPAIVRTRVHLYSTRHECPLFFTQRPFICGYAHDSDNDGVLFLLYDVLARDPHNEIVWCNLRDPTAIAIYKFTVPFEIAQSLQTEPIHMAPTGQALCVGSTILYCDGTIIPLTLQSDTVLAWKNGALYGDDVILHVLH